MDICIDFDGTCVSHAYPQIGKDIGAIPILKRLVDNNHRLILWTARTNMVIKNKQYIESEINPLQNAVNWFKENDIELFGVNENPEQIKSEPTDKISAHLYIDDLALGIPLKLDSETLRFIVDWEKAEKLLIDRSII